MTVQVTPLDDDRLAELDAEPDTEAGAGTLATERGNLPLRVLDVHATVTGLAARTVLRQEFHNPHDVPLEATYVFPLPDRAAVSAMRMTADDRTVVGELAERGAAREAYDEAVAAGTRASITEQERPDVFTMRVGNILPGEQVGVELTMDGPLPYDTDAATYRFPLVVAPRYVPGGPLPGTSVGDGTVPDTDQVPDASRIRPPVLLPGFPEPVRLSITVDIDPAGLPLDHVAASLYDVTTDETATGTRVRIRAGERVDRDFILRLAYAPHEAAATSLVVTPDGGAVDASAADGDASVSHSGDSLASGGHGIASGNGGSGSGSGGFASGDGGSASAGDGSGGSSAAGDGDCSAPDSASDSGGSDWGDGTFRLTVLPPTDRRTRRPRDVVLLLDRSGSMAGWKMVAARRAACRIVDSLTDDDRFGVLLFDHEVEHPDRLPRGLVAATDRHRYRAVEALSRADARGGTEMLRPLTEAAGLLADTAAGREAVLVLVTDGQVANEDQIVAAMSDPLRRVRVHTVGVDRAVNAGFLGRLAVLGGGRCELVESEDRLDEAMARIHRRIGSPVVSGLRLAADGLDLVESTVSPARLPDLFEGVPLVVSGRVRGTGTGGLRLTGTRPDGAPYSVSVAARPAAAPAATAVWARCHLRDLEDRYAAADPAVHEDRIVAASLRFGVLCRFTAFLAVDSRVVTDGDRPHRITQPVELPSGWQPPGPPEAAPMMQTMSMRRAASGGSGGFAPPAPGGPAGPGGVPASYGAAGGAATGPLARHGAPPTHRADPAAEARGALAVELTRLGEAWPTGWLDRLRVLGDLASRLAVLARDLPPADADRLGALADRLAACDGPHPPAEADLERLRRQTRDLLTDLTEDAAGGAGRAGAEGRHAPGRGGTAPRRAFWKRR